MHEPATHMETSDKGTFTIRQGADFLQVSLPTMYSLANSDGFPSLRIGKKILIPIEALKQWVTEQARER